MLTGFYTNLGMGAANMVAIHPPTLISEDIADFLCFDCIRIDGVSLDYLLGESQGPERWICNKLIEHSVLEPVRDVFGPQDVTTAQTLFLQAVQELEIEGMDAMRPTLQEPGPSFERQLNRVCGAGRDHLRSAYYRFLKNYLAMLIAQRQGCALIDATEADIQTRLAILEYAPQLAFVPMAHTLSFLLPTLRTLVDTLGLEITPLPICVTRAGTPAANLSLSNQILGQLQPNEPWYADGCIDIAASEPRLRTFLALRQAKTFKAFQTYLQQASKQIDPDMQPDWMDGVIAHHQQALERLERDFTQRFQRPLKVLHTLAPQDRASFWDDHPAHAWYSFIREDWMETVSGKGNLPKLH